MKLIINASNGNLLSSGESTVLSPTLYDDDGIAISLSKYAIYWLKDGVQVSVGDNLTVSFDDLTGYSKYTCEIKENCDLTSASGEILTDAISNILSADLTLFSSAIDTYTTSGKIQDDFPVNVLDYTFLLASKSHKIYGQIINIDYESVDYKNNLNSYNELNFTIHKTLDDFVEPLWDKIVDFRFIYVPEINDFFEITVQLDDSSDDITKKITAQTACESELSQIYLNDIEINTEDDIARDDYVVTTFYDSSNPKASLLNRVLEKAPSYSIGHVDSTLIKLQRSFSINGSSIYNFLTGDCSEQFNCLFLFDSVNRIINVYDLYTNCLNTQCGYRGEFNDVCPECGGTNLSYFGEDTTIYIDKENLTDSVTLTTDTSSVKNCFKIAAGDDDMTAAVRNVNPSGSDYIYYVNQNQREDMSEELVEKYDQYVNDCDSYSDTYITLNKNIYECLDKILYYTSSMMPTIDTGEDSTAADQVKKLTVENLSPVGLTSVTTSTSVATVNSALKNYAKVYVKAGYFKVEVDTSTGVANEFEYVGTDSDGYNYGTWYGRFKVTNYSDEDDIAYTDYLSFKVYDNYGSFLEQKIKKVIASDDEDGSGNIYDVLSIESLSDFTKAITYYSLNRLKSFYDSIQGVIDVLVEVDQASDGADYYNDIYLPYYNKLQACQKEIDVRQATIDDWQSKYDDYCKQRKEIQEKLNLQTYLGIDLYNEFCLYRREDTYTNDNYISDGLSNDELLTKATELIAEARKELYKSGELQHSISSTLYNLLQIKEFEPLKEHFDVGNWIRINVDGTLYRLRLISYEISFGDLANISVDFSDVTKTANGMLDISSIQAQTQSLTGSYTAISKQVKSTEESANSVSKLLKDGLNASLTTVKNANSEDVVIGKNGIRLRAYDDIYTDYNPEQAALIHNMLVFTRDNWRTAETALGKIKYSIDGQEYSEYGLAANIMVSGKIVSGEIYSSNYSSKEGSETGTHIDLETGSFSLAGNKIKYTAGGNQIELKDVLVSYTTEEGKTDRTDLSKVITGQQTTAIVVDQIKSNYISTDNFYSHFAEVDLAKIKEFYADSAFITSLNASYVTVDDLKGKKGEFGLLYTDDLAANIANIDLLNAETISADSAFIKSLQSTTQTSITSTVNTEFVKDLIVGHATIQDLFTNYFTIGSDDSGSVEINGSTMQFKDADGDTYVQLGTDSSGGHSLIVKDSNGTTLLNGSGITENAIADGLIVNKMVKPKDSNYTGITGDRLDIDSVVTNINNGTTTIKSNLIYFDEDNQTLNTKLSVMQSTISGEIDNISEDLKNNYYTKEESTTQVTTILGETDLTKVNNSVKELSEKTNTVVEKADSIETTLSSDYFTKNDIKNSYYTKSEVYSKSETSSEIASSIKNTDIVTNNAGVKRLSETINEVKSTADTNTSSIKTINDSVDSLKSKQSSFEQDYNGFKTTVADTYITKKLANQLVNGNNLLRNSTTLIFSDYVLGNVLTDASGNVLTDVNGNILIV